MKKSIDYTKGKILVIDPALIQSGWAIGEHGVCTKSGTIKIKPGDKTEGERVRELVGEYKHLISNKGPFKRVCIERFSGYGNKKHIYKLHWAVGALLASQRNAEVCIPVSAWQRNVDWPKLKREIERYDVESEDELAARAMLKWVFETQCGTLKKEKSGSGRRKKRRGKKKRTRGRKKV